MIAAAVGCGRLGFERRVAIDAPADAVSDAPIDAGPPHLVQILAPGYGSAAMMSSTISETRGNLLVAAVYWDESPDTITLTDTAGLAWSNLPIEGIPSVCGGTTGNATGAEIYYAAVSATGPNTVTVAQTSGTQPLGVFLLEYANVATAPDAMSGQVAPSASHAVSAPPITTNGPGVVIAFFNETQMNGMMSGGSGYVVEARDMGFPNLIEDAIEPAGTYTPDGALPNAQSDACWVAIAVAFRAL